MSETSCVDLFCGVGGLTYGLRLSGIKVVSGVDSDEACEYPYEANNGASFLHQDVRAMSGGQLASLFGKADIRILAGCVPCQPFSTYSHRYQTSEASKDAMMIQFAALAKEILPEVVTMENVPLLHNYKLFRHFVESLKNSGYYVWSDVVNCSTYGLPQKRRRTVLLASLLGSIELISPQDQVTATVKASIGKLPSINHGCSNMADPLHIAAKLSNLNLERIRASKPGGTWRDWPKHLIAGCHLRESGLSYPSVYGRMKWDKPAPTLTTQFFGFGNGRFGHPEQDRAISLREGAMLQGFPRKYKFTKKGEVVRIKSVGRMIGNAVPVVLSKIIGRSILKHTGASAVSPKV